jgi:hypothetical protein
MKHLMLDGWQKTGCGLINNKVRDIAAHKTEIDCGNCIAFDNAAKPIRAWNQCKPVSVRKLYLERAGFEPARVERILKIGMWSVMSEKEQKKIVRQMQDNPILARLMGLEVWAIARGGELDKRGKFNHIQHKHSFCSICGANR